MELEELILANVDDSKNKTLLEVGSHGDELTLKLAPKFKKIYSYYEFLKIPDRVEGNIEIKKMPYLSVLGCLDEFDVIFLENEFHHFPDIYQMWTYEKLRYGQKIILVEWDFTGSNNQYYQSFQNCRPLCELTREILEKSVKKGLIEIIKKEKSEYKITVNSEKDMVNHYKFELPDHWHFGEKEFMKKIENISYPLTLTEGFDFFVIEKA